METLLMINEVLPTADWSIETFLDNAFDNVEGIGGSLLMLMGILAVIWGGVLLFKKLMAGQKDQTSWGTIAMLIVIGGAVAFGGAAIVFDIAESSEDTIHEIGN